MGTSYYTLVGSLPHLPHFEKARRLPLSRLKLDQRLRMLPPEDAEELARAEALAGWQMTLAKPRTDTAMTTRCRDLLAATRQPALREYLEFRFSLQTLVAALRRRKAGLPAPGPGEPWGIGPEISAIERHWEEPDFRLALLHPWLPEARQRLDDPDARGLERLLMDLLWRRLGRIAEADPFGFGAVIAFVFRWDILRAWLARDAATAKIRFQAMIEEVTDAR